MEMLYSSETLSPTGLHVIQKLKILKLIEPLLCNDREISKYTRAFSRQRLGKHVPVAMDMHARTEVLLETAFSTRYVPRSYKEDNWSKRVILVREAVKKGTVGREPPYRKNMSLQAED
jgi:hypothetical protein